MAPLLEAFGLTKRYGDVPAVDGVDLTILPGETLGLVGESGCGKSTLGRLLIRLIPATAGRVVFDGTDITALGSKALRTARKGMQIVFQDPFGALNPRMTIEATVMEPLLIHGARKTPATLAAVTRMLDMVGLPDSARHRYPHAFSGGQRQRIGIARALILRPRLVICDEPVSALDVSVQAQIINLLSDLQAELGLTYLFIAHDLAVMKHISARVAVMYLGKIVEIADKRALYGNPNHPYTQALLGSVPVTHPSQRTRRVRTAGDISAASLAGCRFHGRCPQVMPVCRTLEPSMRQIGPGHHAACHLLADARLV
jgi:oligopeptide/dipeptide ABC transporter ATP-binding protein